MKGCWCSLCECWDVGVTGRQLRAACLQPSTNCSVPSLLIECANALQAGHWLSEGITNWSSGLTDTVHTGLSAVQQLWANADASMQAASEETAKSDVQVSQSCQTVFNSPESRLWLLHHTLLP